jgi:hypothetical protein
LDCTWTDKEAFKNKTETEAVTDAHFGAGQQIRNNWGLWEGKNSLYQEFKSLGVTFPEDISTIILTSFYRRLNHQDIDLKGQIQKYKLQKKQNKINKDSMNSMAKRLTIGDTVTVVFSRAQSAKDNYSLALLGYDAPLDRPTNCIIQGIVKQKKKSKGSAILTIQITSTGNCTNSYYGDKAMTIGQTFSYNMTYFNLRGPIIANKRR